MEGDGPNSRQHEKKIELLKKSTDSCRSGGSGDGREELGKKKVK